MTSDSNGSALPRFTPQPGGFGRRATPVGTTTAAPAASPRVQAEAVVQMQPQAQPQAETKAPPQQQAWSLNSTGVSAQFHRTEAPAATVAGSGQDAPRNAPTGDVATRIADWLMRELRDDRGLHCETLLTATGALAGYATQQSLWEGMIKPGKMAIAQVFKVIETGSGEAFFYGDVIDNMLVSPDPKHQSLWRTISSAALAEGGENLPEMASMLRHCNATMGTPQFGLPRLPDEHLPSMLPRAALNRLWPGARLFLALSDPLIWPQHMAQVTQRLMHATRDALPLDLALKIVMEAAVPMSRVDPTTVPND